MNSETEQQLPKINFSGLAVGTPEWIAVRVEVMNALHIYGSFEAVYDPLQDPKLREKVFKKGITELFDLPVDVKSRSASYSNKLYVPSAQGITVYEGNVESIRSFTSVMWPQGNPNFWMIMEDLGVEDKYYDEMNQKTKYILNASCYKSEEKEDKDEQYMGAHTDPNFITIIGQDEVDGLEVLIKTGTKGFIIQTPPELIDATHPPLYKPSDFNDYFQFYSSEMSFKTTTPLKTFCGIDDLV
ncbi:probable 2-oxoglutarate-dependent dioxygenase AOP1 [Dioscorea cayenensis subsp. rotundata]|uniref:Probable 2-oxoglutarate-dependent dioxygenase AOP1 n=1 Tax=Dioscorea cayennensis subsp. rotundata TaxID=55577 RepID=A0AB40B847_DIOCR|nr:probable 2-oxoglutarate-dependent dioxygenase AOP1 [Dioscorea cayenensis subsp. rotundata]